MFTVDEISEMTREGVEQAMNELDRKYGLDRTITQYTDDIDRAVNILCDLTRRLEMITAAEGYEKSVATLRANRVK
jgi:hypothetical protein